ncbi:MAG TPA: adenylate/guanylate cyclase domain-containing protein, partial [Candidatus Rifleibacterium sp.]|nr:adenylate/guanylate cyclase domain-containing protein [Candidatus Rifleibacterium sp.]
AAESSGSLHFSMATGVNAGRVISGMLGFGSKRDFTVIGDAVNVSARIQKEAEKLPESRCLYSESFIKGLSDASGFVMHGETALKGKAEKARLFRRA